MSKGNRRAVIIGGAKITDYDKIREHLRENDFFIYCDSGLYHLESLGARPDLIIGDFDSHPLPEQPEIDPGKCSPPAPDHTEPAPYGQQIRHTRTSDGTELIILPHMKDWTDTVYASMEAARRGFQEVLLIGASGGRPDHYFGNIFILNKMEMQGIEAWILDDISIMRVFMAGRPTVEIPDSVRYFSLLPFDGEAAGIRVSDALYPLEDATMRADDPYGISNEVPEGKTARVSLSKGKLLVIEIFRTAGSSPEKLSSDGSQP